MSTPLFVRETEIIPAAPYDFAQALAYLRFAHSAILERITDDAYQRAMHLAGHDVLVTMRSIGTMEAPRLLVRVTGAVVDDAVVTAACVALRRIFTLDADPAPFLATLVQDPIFAATVRPFPGLRPVLIASPYEALLWAVIGQQINVTFAAKLKRALVDLAGRSIAVDGQVYQLLPHPADVAAIDPAALRERQFSQQKIAYCLAVSQAIATGDLDIEALATLPAEDVLAQLIRHKGIGRWTAECVLMRGLGAVDTIPAGDVGLQTAIGRAYGLGRHAREDEVRERAEAWAGWRGWATFFWWLSVQTTTLAKKATQIALAEEKMLRGRNKKLFGA